MSLGGVGELLSPATFNGSLGVSSFSPHRMQTNPLFSGDFRPGTSCWHRVHHMAYQASAKHLGNYEKITDFVNFIDREKLKNTTGGGYFCPSWNSEDGHLGREERIDQEFVVKSTPLGSSENGPGRDGVPTRKKASLVEDLALQCSRLSPFDNRHHSVGTRIAIDNSQKEGTGVCDRGAYRNF